MKNLQKVGGVAAILHSLAYLIGIALYITMMSTIIDVTPEQYVSLLPEYKNILSVWILIAYLVAGFCLVPVSLAFYERLKNATPSLIQIATVLGFIWATLIIGSGNLMLHGFEAIANLYAKNPAQSETVYITLAIVQNGIVSANELTGGVWVLLLSWSALQVGQLSKILNYLGLLIGVSGLLTLIPPIAESAQMFFGLSMIVWFAWVGIILLRKSSVEIIDLLQKSKS